MATIVNEIDVILQAASPRILPVAIPSNYTVPWTGVTSKPPILGETATISDTNYATYMDAQSISTLAYSENTSHLTSTGTLTTTLNFDSKGENVLVVLSGSFSSNGFATTGTCSCDVHFDIVSGSTYLLTSVCSSPNLTGDGVTMTWARTVYIPSPGTGTKTYRLQVDFTESGDGAGGEISNTAIQIIGLHR
jgi:hypothetical protein